MNLKIVRIPLKSLWNSEYTLLINQIISIIEKYKPDALHLKKALDALKAFLSDLAKIKAQEMSNTLSRKLNELDDERDILVDAIIGIIKAMGKLTIPSSAPHVAVLTRFFDTHGRDIANDTYNAETKRINDLLADHNTKADVKAAVEALHHTILFDQLGLINNKFAALFLQRTEEDAAHEKVDARQIRTNTDKALANLFSSFEHCTREYDDLDYTTPAKELNILITYYKTQLKARITRRNSGKDVTTEAPIDTPK